MMPLCYKLHCWYVFLECDYPFVIACPRCFSLAHSSSTECDRTDGTQTKRPVKRKERSSVVFLWIVIKLRYVFL
jgi:hypothetical protein